MILFSNFTCFASSEVLDYLKVFAVVVDQLLSHMIFIAKALYLAGFRRFGPANTFIHTDDDVNKPQFANWGYPTPLFDVFSLVA